MQTLKIGDNNLHFRDEGDPGGAPVVFSNSLGTDLRLWDDVVALLPPGLRIIRYDMRGHGLSDCPRAPYAMGAMVHDLEGILDALNVRDAVLVGLSVGGMIAQGLAAKRLDQIRAVVLSNTGVKIGTKDLWQERIDMVAAQGLTEMSDAIMERWFSRKFREGGAMAPWRRMVETTPAEGYAGVCAAIAGSDFITPTSGLRLPAMVIAGSEDGATPPDLVRDLADLIPGARFELMRGLGHLPCVEQPGAYAALLTDFLASIGHGGAR